MRLPAPLVSVSQACVRLLPLTAGVISSLVAVELIAAASPACATPPVFAAPLSAQAEEPIADATPQPASPEPDRPQASKPALNPVRGKALASMLIAWAEAFDRGEVDPRGHIRCGDGDHPLYGTTHQPGAELRLMRDESIPHLDALRYLVFALEKYEGDHVAEALLRVAAVGLDRPLSDKGAQVVRDTAHYALLRSADQRTWPILVRLVSGVRELHQFSSAIAGDDERRADEDRLVLPALRVAALRALGQKKIAGCRGVVEHSLIDADSRVRLAAAEALTRMKTRQSLSVLSRAFASEQHPAVAAASLRAIDKIIQGNLDRVHPDRVRQTTRTVLRAVGRIGWRTDMEIVRIAEAYPCRDAVPALILMMRESEKEDKLVEAVNKRARASLRARALAGLKRITGAIEPDDTPASWEAFWIRERGNFHFDEAPRARVRPKTSSSFFGIPVTGEEFAFVVDTSGSMNEPCEYGRDTRSRKEDPPTRLEVAKAQIFKAVHAMDTASRYHLITFAGGVTTWNPYPVPPTARSHAALTGLLGRIQPGGGTNLAGSLEAALDPEDLKFGQERTNHIDEIFVLSDGQPSSGLTEPAEILALVERINPEGRVRIHVVFAGNRGDPGEALLQGLAEKNGGVFVRVN